MIIGHSRDPRHQSYLGFDKVSNAGFGHDGGWGVVTAFLILRSMDCVGHAGDSSVPADVNRDVFEGHDGDGSGGFSVVGVMVVLFGGDCGGG